ncbi:MAG: DUF11 domain-containing protein [Anaerolineaceae bacterium]|nr:DUF11 domain-containing protein [Anaerolineaceae bacterium]
MRKLSKSVFLFVTLIMALILSPVATVLAINYEAQINVGFDDGSLLVGEDTILTIEILNTNPFILENVSFTNSLLVGTNTGLVVHADGVLTNTCGGTVIATADTTKITLSGGEVPAATATQGRCEMTIRVLATSPGTKNSYVPSYGNPPSNGGVGLYSTARGGLDIITNATRLASITTLSVTAVETPSMNKNFSPSTVWAGESTQLEINLTNNDEDHALTGVTYTDTLPWPFVVSSPLTTSLSGCGGGTISTSVGSNTITLNNGTIAADSLCRVRVRVVSSLQGTYTNTIPAGPAGVGSVQTDQYVTNPADVTAPVNVQSVGISKQFSPDSFAQGDTSTLTITLRNPSGTTYTNMAFDDILPGSLVVSGTPAASQCGGTVSVPSSNTIRLVGGVIPPGNTTTPGSCTIVVTVTSPTFGGPYTNTIPAGALTGSVTNLLPASDNVTVVQRTILVDKYFGADFVENGTTSLSIRLRNQASTAFTGVTFTDTMPANLTIVGTPTTSASCGPGAVVSSTGTSLTLTGAMIPAGSVSTPGECWIYATVTSSVVNTGGYTNSIAAGDINSDQGIDNANGDSDIVRVYPINGNATVAKSFLTSTILPGSNSTLRIRITSPRDTGLSQIHLIDNLPGDMVVTGSPITNSCGGTLSAVIGSQLIELTNGTITNPNSTCTIEVPVTAYTPGTLTNSIPANSLSTYEGRTDTVTRSANLYVTSFSMTKQFAPDLIAPGGLSLLTVFLSNSSLQPITDVSLSDYLYNMDYSVDGYTVRVHNPGDPAYVPSTDCTGGIITAVDGDDEFSMSGATIPASDGSVDGLCRINVYVEGQNTSGILRTRTNTISRSSVNGTINGSTSIQPIQNASASLGIEPLEIRVDKAFSPLSVFNGSYSTMTIELQNPSSAATLSQIAFTDNMPPGMILATPTGFNTGTCGGILTGSPGDASFSFSDGSLPASGTCTLSIQVSMTVTGNLTNTINIGDVTSFEGAVNSNQEDETLTNAVLAYIVKSFSPNPILVGEESVLSIQIFNTSTSTDLTGMGANDNLPAGVTIADDGGTTDPILENTCGTSSTLTTGIHSTGPYSGRSYIELVNGTIPQSDSCLMRIRVTSNTVGAYDNIITTDDVTPPIDPDDAEDTLYVTSFSLGNRVWEDNGAGGGTANDGIRNGSEPGMSGLDVNLYEDANDDGTPDGVAIGTTTTDGDGYYRFDSLAANTYIVEVEIPGGYISSAINGGDPDSDTDNDNNGVNLINPGYIRSNPVTLEYTSIEPTDDNDPVTNPDTGEGINEQSNRTVDFGFVNAYSLGNRVWDDNGAGGGTVNDGTQNGAEPGISGVTVRLYLDADANDVPDGSMIDFTVTDGNGYYRFDDLYASSYIVEVVTPAGYRATNNAVSDPNGDVDLDHNGYVVNGVNVRSNHVTLGPNADEPESPDDDDPVTNPESGEAPDDQSNRTVDFGFTNAYSLGNRVWHDNGEGGGTADNGIHDGTEPGFGGLTVNLYQDSDDNGIADGGVISSTTTNTNGYYRFDNLSADTYIVELELPTGYQVSAVNGGDPDNDTDLDNNGVVAGAGVIRSNPVTLAGGLEPVSPDDDDPATNPLTGEAPDAYSNRTVDFGLYAAPLSLGNLVWVDNGAGGGTVDNGIHDGTEPGLSGVTVRLYQAANLTTPLRITETDTNGNYLFSNLPADDYVVEIIIPTGYTPSSVNNPADPTDTTDEDNNGVTLNGSTLQSNTIVLDADNLTIDFGLIQFASLGDRVWYDTNRDGVQDAGEDGVTGVTVNLFTGTPGSGTLESTTTTTGGGYYSFTDLAPASDYYVEFILPTDYNFSPSGAGTASTDSDATTVVGPIGRTINIDLEAFENDITWDAGIYLPPASIGDLVWYDDGSGGGTARDGVQNGTEPGASGIRVDLFRPGYGADGIPSTPDDNLSMANQLTDGSGNYLFDELLPGDYYVSFTQPAGYAFSPLDQGGDDATDSDANRTTGDAILTTLDAGEDDLTWDAGLYELASIGDYVWLDHGGGVPANAYNGIQDASEAGIPSVTVNLYDSGDTLIGSTVTNGLGRYLFSNIEPGDYYVEFIPPTGYSISPQDAGGDDATDSDADTTSGQTIPTTLDAGENDLTWDAGMYRYAAIGDLVWDDNGAGGGTPRDGIQNGSESGVAGVTVTLYNSSDVQVGTPVITGANGLYAFTELVPGDYYVIFSDLPADYQFSDIDQGGDDALDSDANTTTGRTITTTLSPGENDITWDAGIHLIPAEIGDYVWYDSNGNGIQEGGETPADGVTVTLYNSTGTVVDTTVTNGAGNYLFTDLNPGYYYLEFTAPVGYNFTLSDQGGDDATDSDAIIPLGRTNLTQLTPGESDLTWDAGLYTNASLGDFVWEDWNMDGIQDTPDTGINGITVDLYHNTLGYVDTTTTADFGGNPSLPGYYLFEDLVPGDYYVIFTLPSGYQFSTQNAGADDTVDSDANTTTGQSDTVSLGSGDTNLTLDAGLIPLFSLGNRVWFDTDNGSDIDAGEVGVSGVTVQLYDSTGTTEILVGPDGILGTADDAAGGVTTDANGYYLFNDLLPGNYMVVLPESNFSGAGVLTDYYSTGTSRNNDGSITESVAALANSNIDSDDNGTLQTSGAHSGAVTTSVVSLGGVNPASEPINESDLGPGGQGGRPDNYGNMTVDFGFYHAQIGNLVWNDADNSGTANSESGIDGVTVQLLAGNGTTVLDSTTTSGGGIYSFTDLPAGNYYIRIPAAEFETTETLRDFRSSTGGSSEPAPNPDTDTDDNDDNGSEANGTLGLGGYIQTAVFALSPGSEQSVVNASGLTIENRVDLGVYDAPQVDLAVTKTDGQTYFITDSTLNYTIVVTNNGPADATGAVVTDSLPAQIDSWTWTCASSDYGCDGAAASAAPFSDTIDLPYDSVTPRSVTYNVAAHVSATADIDNDLVNTVVVTTPGYTETDNTNNSATDTDQPASITITKDDNVDIVAPNTVVTYEVEITNNGDVPLTNLTVTDTIPNEMTFVRAYQGANDTPPTSISGSDLTWDWLDTTDRLVGTNPTINLANLPSGEVIRFNIEARVASSLTVSSFTNTIDVEDGNTGANDEGDDTDNLLNANIKNLTGTSEADSGSGSIVDPEPVFIGEIIEYTITLDIPPGTASNLQALDVMDQGLAFVSCTGITSGALTTTGDFTNACANPTVSAEPVSSLESINQGRRVLFDLDDVTNGGAGIDTLTITYEAIVLDIASNSNGVDDLNNALTWSWDTISSISDEATPVTIDEPQLTISKRAQPTTAAYGTPIDFTLEISHAAISTAPAYDVILTDILPTGLAYIPLSATSTGLAPNDMINVYNPATSTLTFEWDVFPLAATSTINFQATFVGPSPVENEASVEWTSIEIDPQLDGTPVQLSPYNIHSTERWYDPLDQTINDYGVRDNVEIRTPAMLPLTGFAPDVASLIPAQPSEKAYFDLEPMYIEIPKLELYLPITGVPYVDDDWDLTWLADQAGYLEGTTFPGQLGNTALTAHVVLADGTPGPFAALSELAWGDQIILHMDGQKYIYELRHNLTVYPNDFSTFYYDGYTWLTLITCEGYNEYADDYLYRTLVKAVLVSTELE